LASYGAIAAATGTALCETAQPMDKTERRAMVASIARRIDTPTPFLAATRG